MGLVMVFGKQIDPPELSPIRAGALAAAISISVLMLIFAVREAGYLQSAEMLLYDKLTAAGAISQPALNVVTVAIDDKDLLDWGWPVPDGKLASIIVAVEKAGAIAIGVDIYRDRPVPPGESELSKAFTNSGAIAIYKLRADGKVAIAPPSFALESGLDGFSDMPLDFDSMVRRTILIVNDDAAVRQSFGLRLANKAMGQSSIGVWPEDPHVIMFGSTPVPQLKDGFGSYRGLDDSGYQILIDFRNALPITPNLLARDVLSGLANPDVLAGKVVVIGTTSDSVKDYFRTPLNRDANTADLFGIQVHAAVVQQILNYASSAERPLQSPPARVQAFLILAGSVLGCGLALTSRTAVRAILFGPGATLAIAATMSLAQLWGVWLPALPVSLAWLSAFLLMFSSLAVITRQRHRLMRRLFSDLLSPKLSREIWKNKGIILAGGRPTPKRLFSTVLFSDLAGSTKIGGSAEAGEFLDWISKFLDQMSIIAQDHDGFVEKYTGDGIMIVFGAPLPSLGEDDRRRDAEAACRCALAMAEAVERLNEGEVGLAPYRVRIGIHSGEVLGGTIGTSGSMRYNIIGDTANIASRVEGFGKSLRGGQKRATIICLTKMTADLANSIVHARLVGNLLHDNQKTEIEILELIGTT